MLTKIRPEDESKVFAFLDNLVPDLHISDYVNLSQINDAIEDEEDIVETIRELIEGNNGFDCEVIYYSNAINYLAENDASLKESIEIATEFGYQLNDISSELLATLLKSQKTRDSFEESADEINEYFESYE